VGSKKKKKVKMAKRMKLLYEFLSEKGYIDDYTVMTGIIDKMEPHFIKNLRKRFG
jgi:hypothetical protein